MQIIADECVFEITWAGFPQPLENLEKINFNFKILQNIMEKSEETWKIRFSVIVLFVILYCQYILKFVKCDNTCVK